jgi:hypothetical protein
LIQGVNTVKVWACAAGCYVPYFIPEGGSAVNGTYQILNTLPFYSESKSNPALSSLAQALGGANKMDSNAMSSYVEALWFENAVEKAVANGGTLTRASLFKVLNTDETSFNADGIVGQTDVSTHAPSPCFVLAQVVNDKWKRVYPTKAGTFDCNKKNLVTLKFNGASS